MPGPNDIKARVDRYRLESKHLRMVAGTLAEGEKRKILLQIAEAYERLADRIAGAPLHLVSGEPYPLPTRAP
jgi:hypothetical protein